jgi:glyoxylase-like metal-dependent hydrolase (beta-lactamase superfamily II)
VRGDSFELGPLQVIRFELGMALTNAYLLGDGETGEAVVIDPAWDGDQIAAAAEERGWRIGSIWLSHAHFDHFGGAGGVADAYDVPVPVALHALDQPLWRAHGGASYFGLPGFDPGPEPTIDLEPGMRLKLGRATFEVRFTPGHTPGHVVFVSLELGAVFCGDVIFQGSVGRIDLPGGDWNTLLQSIRDEILTLPDATRLFPGHGPDTTVGAERANNPFLN